MGNVPADVTVQLDYLCVNQWDSSSKRTESNELERTSIDHSGCVLGLRQLVGWAGDLTTTEITDPSEDCSNKAIIVSSGLSVEVSKTALLEKQGGSADIEIIGESRVTVPRLAYLLIDTRHNVKVTVSVIRVIGKSEFVDRGPPSSVGSRDFDIGVVHWPNCTDQMNIARY